MSIWKTADELNQLGKCFVIVTMVEVRGSSPQDVGAKIIVTKDGLHTGTVGGGKVEMAAIKKSLLILENKSVSPPEIVKWNLQKDIGMSCGGEVTFLFEHFYSKDWPIVVFGAGHVSQALTRVLKNLKCDLVCVDSRQEWVDKLEIEKKICHPSPKDLVASFDPKSFFICMTMGHAFDVPILLEISKHAPNCPYVGVIGSTVKGKKIKSELKDLGVSLDFLEKLRVPMGLELGSNDPAEIAISIAAELIMARDTKKD